jgi:hypothetical protein
MVMAREEGKVISSLLFKRDTMRFKQRLNKPLIDSSNIEKSLLYELYMSSKRHYA